MVFVVIPQIAWKAKGKQLMIVLTLLGKCMILV